jgi:DNA-binding beta-propeller fold protein YncE
MPCINLRTPAVALAAVLLATLWTAASAAAEAGVVMPFAPGPIAYGPDGALYTSDCYAARIYRVTPAGSIRVIAGTGPGGFLNGYTGDGGLAVDAEFSCPTGLAFDRAGNLYVADHGNNAIRRIDRSGIVTTIAGQGPYGSGPWTPGIGKRAGDGGPATQAVLDSPWGIAFDAHGNLLIGDREHDAIRMVDTRGIISTVAGTGVHGFTGDGGPAIAAKLDRALYAVPTADGGFVIGDEDNNRLRRVSPGGLISTLAGNGELGDAGDGGPATSAQLENPNGVAVAPNGNIYVVQDLNHRVRMIDAAGTIHTVVGTGQLGCTGFNGGPAAGARLSSPNAVAFDPRGNLYLTDADCGVILRMDTGGHLHVVAQP